MYKIPHISETVVCPISYEDEHGSCHILVHGVDTIK